MHKKWNKQNTFELFVKITISLVPLKKATVRTAHSLLKYTTTSPIQ